MRLSPWQENYRHLQNTERREMSPQGREQRLYLMYIIFFMFLGYSILSFESQRKLLHSWLLPYLHETLSSMKTGQEATPCSCLPFQGTPRANIYGTLPNRAVYCQLHTLIPICKYIFMFVHLHSESFLLFFSTFHLGFVIIWEFLNLPFKQFDSHFQFSIDVLNSLFH